SIGWSWDTRPEYPENAARRCARCRGPERTLPARPHRAPRPYEDCLKRGRSLTSLAMRTSLALLCAALALPVLACSKTPEPTTDFKPSVAAADPPGPTKLEIVDEVVGTGREAKTGDNVEVHYTGTLMGGKQFDSSRGKETFKFQLGQGSV